MSKRAPTQSAACPAPGLRGAVEAHVLDRFAPAHVIVTGAGEVVHFAARTGRYLEPAAGAPTQQLIALARPELQQDLKSALRQAVETAAPARRDGVVLTGEDGLRLMVDIAVEPFPEDRGAEPLFIILFVERAAPRAGEHGAMSRLAEGAGVPMVLLGRDMAIHDFTPPLKTLFNIRPEDRGRPLTDLTSRLPLPGLVEAVEGVFVTGALAEQQVYQESTKTHFLVRFIPLDGAVDDVAVVFVDITRLTQEQGRQQGVIAELNHRVKNMLTVVIGLAQQTHQSAGAPLSFIEAFTSRLGGMARSYDLLSHEHWTETSLDRLVRAVLGPFHMERVSIGGPFVALEPRVTLSLGMVLHELVTNAGRFGALSTPDGAVAIDWSLTEGGAGTSLALRWEETNGPATAPPHRRGFGLKFIEREVAYNLEGEAQVEFPSEGLRAHITLPLERPR